YWTQYEHVRIGGPHSCIGDRIRQQHPDHDILAPGNHSRSSESADDSASGATGRVAEYACSGAMEKQDDHCRDENICNGITKYEQPDEGSCKSTDKPQYYCVGCIREYNW